MTQSFPGLRAAVALVAAIAAAVAVLGVVVAGPAVALVPPPSSRLPAPFACGTEWQGSTYAGHGANNWNLDLNRADPGDGSDVGEPVLAQGDGVVVWFTQTGYNRGAGTYVEVDYGDVTVRYIHLVEGSIPGHLAAIGATVEAGEPIGLLGATGHVTGPHLHLEYWDSEGFDDTAWYQLPRGNQIAVTFDGVAMVAEPGQPTAVFVSGNCPKRAAPDKAPAGWAEAGPMGLLEGRGQLFQGGFHGGAVVGRPILDAGDPGARLAHLLGDEVL